MQRLAHIASLAIAGFSCLCAEEVATTVGSLPDTIKVQLASAAGGEPLTDTSVVTEDGKKVYVAHYRNRSTGEMQTVRVAENGSVQANEPRRPSQPPVVDPRPREDAAPAQPPVVQPPAVGTTREAAPGPARVAGPTPVEPPHPAEPPKKAGPARPEPKDAPPRKSDAPQGERERKPDADEPPHRKDQKAKPDADDAQPKDEKAKPADSAAGGESTGSASGKSQGGK